jgi:hypothetical protein
MGILGCLLIEGSMFCIWEEYTTNIWWLVMNCSLYFCWTWSLFSHVVPPCRRIILSYSVEVRSDYWIYVTNESGREWCMSCLRSFQNQHRVSHVFFSLQFSSWKMLFQSRLQDKYNVQCCHMPSALDLQPEKKHRPLLFMSPTSDLSLP